jgi:apolipoprotein D and lipocalin family protein
MKGREGASDTEFSPGGRLNAAFCGIKGPRPGFAPWAFSIRDDETTPQMAFALRILSAVTAAAALTCAAPALGAPAPPQQHLELGHMMGRWYEVARLPNKTQHDCQGGTSDWVKSADGYSVVQTCHRGSLTAPPTEWKAKAKVVDPQTNARFKMSFFGGLVSQEYWVLDSRTDQGWLILGTPGGHFLWLMSQRPSLAPAAKAQAVARIRQLGYDVAALEYPLPARN